MHLECTVCGSPNLVQDGEGGLVCEDCNNVIDNYREEELDDYVQGTVRKNRESELARSSQLQSSLKAKTPIHSKEEVLDNDIVLRSAVVKIVQAQTKYLVDNKLAPAEIKTPVWKIMSHYFSGSRGVIHESQHFMLKLDNFSLPMTLAFISLAAVYVRCPLLPRDLVNLVCSGNLPYVCAAREYVDHKVMKRKKVKVALTPMELPAVTHVVQRATLLVTTEGYRWPPLRCFFFLDYERYYVHFRAFPVGNVELVLMKMLDHVGLPKTMYPRVLRYRELRRSAGAAMLKANTRTIANDNFVDFESAVQGPRADEHAARTVESLLPHDSDRSIAEGVGGWGRPFLAFRSIEKVRPLLCCAAHETDYMCIGDVVNTVRICFGEVDSRGHRDKTPEDNGSEKLSTINRATTPLTSAFDGQPLDQGHPANADYLQAERARYEAELRRVHFGCSEKERYVHWTNLTPPAMRTLRRGKLREYIHLSENSERRELPTQPFWNEFNHFFDTIARRAEPCESPTDKGSCETFTVEPKLRNSGGWVHSNDQTEKLFLTRNIDDEIEEDRARETLQLQETCQPTGNSKGVKKTDGMSNMPELVDERPLVGLLINELVSYVHGTKAALKNRTPLDANVARGLHIAVDQNLALVVAYADLYLDGKTVSSQAVPHPYPRFCRGASTSMT